MAEIYLSPGAGSAVRNGNRRAGAAARPRRAGGPKRQPGRGGDRGGAAAIIGKRRHPAAGNEAPGATRAVGHTGKAGPGISGAVS
jgi:hypothetical protein